jgi:hypothetical protein
MADTAGDTSLPDMRSLLERTLGLIAEVRAGEGVTVLLMALNLFLVLTSYYMLKTIREALILTEGGAAVKTYSSAGQALLLLLLVPAFGAFASRVNRARLLRGVTLFFVANVVVFLVVGRGGVHVAVPFFIWVGIFNVMIVAQYWSFANDIYTPEQGSGSSRSWPWAATWGRGWGRSGLDSSSAPSVPTRWQSWPRSCWRAAPSSRKSSIAAKPGAPRWRRPRLRRSPWAVKGASPSLPRIATCS